MRTKVRMLTAVFASVATSFATCMAPAAASITPTDIQKLLASDGVPMGDQLGMSVAIDGSTAVVGAPSDDNRVGAAYVYTLSSGTWTQQQKLTASDGEAWDIFGMAVAISGDTVLVGAHGDETGRGAAYVFTRSGGVWTLQQKLTASVGESDNFGISVALLGDVALIGAPIDNDDKGRAYIFTRSGGAWTQQAMLEASDGAPNDRFGWAVAMTSSTIVIGAQFVNEGRGAAYVFSGSGSSWAEQQKLTAGDGSPSDTFGFAVDVYGDTVIVGASTDDDKGTDSGSAYVFTRSGGTWAQQQKLTAIDGAAQDYFGDAVAVYADMAVVGAPDVGDVGKVYVYARAGTTWSEQAQLVPVNTVFSPALLFGRSVGLDGNTVFVGMPGDNWFKGAAYAFTLPQATTDETPPVVTAVTADDVVYPADAIVIATATDAGSNLKSAEYSLDGEPWTAMGATDGTFDEKSEGLTATIPGPLAVDTYEVCVRATDTADNASDGEDCDTFAVTAAAMTIRFDGEFLDLNGSPTLLKSTVGGPDACKQGATVEFYEGTFKLGQATTNTSGIAQLSLSGLSYLVHEIKAVVLDRDFDEDGATECTGDDDTGTTVVADPNASSTGGGWYFVDLGPGSKYKLNFGYTVQRKYDRKAGEWLTSGNVLWISNNAYKLKGRIDEGGKLPVSECASGFAACAAFGGDGVLYEHNPDYSAYYCSLGETYRCAEWVNPQPVTFTFFANDGGTSRVCTTNAKGKTTCKESLKPDAFGMQLDIVSLSEESSPTLLNGGNVVVK